MTRQSIEMREQEDQDFLDTAPLIGRATTRLERSFGPSCFLSLIIVFLLLLVVRQYMQVSWPVLLGIIFVVWFGVLNLLIRWRPDRVEEED